jgi:hypothetical protein
MKPRSLRHRYKADGIKLDSRSLSGPVASGVLAFQAEGRRFESGRAHSSLFRSVLRVARCRAKSSVGRRIGVPAASWQFRAVPARLCLISSHQRKRAQAPHPTLLIPI